MSKALLAKFVPIDQLIPYARNARTHSDAQVMQIAASIAEFGFTNPVLADAEGIVAGHGRVMGARQLYSAGKTILLPSGEAIPAGTVPVIDCTGWSDAKRRAYILADNQLALNAGWDVEKLSLEIKDLSAMGFDLPLMGFDEKSLARYLADPPNTVGDPEEAPDFPVVPTAKRGDVWILGKHRLVCGDSTQADDVAKALNGVTPHLMVTDPPYGVEYDAEWRTKQGLQKKGAHGKVANDERCDWRQAWALFPGDACYVWHAFRHALAVAESLVACDFQIRAEIVWKKSSPVIGRGDYHAQHESCWYAVRKGKAGHWNGDRKQTTVWDIDKPRKSETGHSTQKPVECMAKPIRNNSSPGQAIYEPFAGSGTTLIACEMEGRVCHAIEIEPKYIDVIIQRWQKTFDREAVREADGAKYNHIAFAKAPARAVVSAKPKAAPKSAGKAKKPPKPAGDTLSGGQNGAAGP